MVSIKDRSRIKVSISAVLISLSVVSFLIGVPGMMEDLGQWKTWVLQAQQAIPWQLAVTVGIVCLMAAGVPWIPGLRRHWKGGQTKGDDAHPAATADGPARQENPRGRQDLRAKVEEWWVVCGDPAFIAASRMYSKATYLIGKTSPSELALRRVIKRHFHNQAAEAQRAMRDYVHHSRRSELPIEELERWAFYYREKVELVVLLQTPVEKLEEEGLLSTWEEAQERLRSKTVEYFASRGFGEARRTLAKASKIQTDYVRDGLA